MGLQNYISIFPKNVISSPHISQKYAHFFTYIIENRHKCLVFV